MRVAVLGSGPAGLLAAHALTITGNQFTIFTKTREPSTISGAQYVHEPIPDVCGDPDGEVVYHKYGTREGYATKVYGSPDATCSWDIFPEGPRPCWNMRRVYYELYKRYNEFFNIQTVDRGFLDYLDNKRDMFPLCISAIPASVLCQCPQVHSFESAKVRFEKHNHRDSALGKNYVYYSGDTQDPWYRSSYIFGQGWWEFGMMADISHRTGEVVEGIKPLDTDCNCRKRIVRVGRFGEWKKGVLVHNAFYKTLDALEVAKVLQT